MQPRRAESVENYGGQKFSVNYQDTDDSRVTQMFDDAGLVKGDDIHKSSAWRASYNIICTVVGTGLLQLPYALQQSGWIGVGMLLLMAAMATYTAIVLIKCLNPPTGERLVTYGDVGRYAFGLPGQIVVEIMLHLTLIGVSTIYLILAGDNVSQLLNQVPTNSDYCSIVNIDYHLTTLVIAGILWFHVFLKTLHEVGVLSTFNVGVAVFLLLVVVTEILLNFPDQSNVEHHLMVKNISLGGAFASFSFSFGAHAILPTVYENMAKPSSFNKMIIITFAVILMFYLPLAIIGYWAYGDGTQTPIYVNLCSSDASCNLAEKLGVFLAILSVTIHIMFSYAIVINPTELAVERLFKTDQRSQPLLWRVSLRTILVLTTLVIGESIKNFGDFLDLVSAVTNSFTTFVLPCVFYLRIFWKETNPLIITWNVLIITAALAGFIFGGYDALASVLCDVSNGSWDIFPSGTSCPPPPPVEEFPSCF